MATILRARASPSLVTQLGLQDHPGQHLLSNIQRGNRTASLNAGHLQSIFPFTNQLHIFLPRVAESRSVSAATLMGPKLNGRAWIARLHLRLITCWTGCYPRTQARHPKGLSQRFKAATQCLRGCPHRRPYPAGDRPVSRRTDSKDAR